MSANNMFYISTGSHGSCVSGMAARLVQN